MKEMHELKDKLSDQLKDYSRQDITTGNLDIIDKLTHALKNLERVIENEEHGEGYSSRHYPMYRDGMYNNYDRGMSSNMGYRDRYSGMDYPRNNYYDERMIDPRNR